MTIPAMSGAVWVTARLDKDNEEVSVGWNARGLTPTYAPFTTRVRGGNQVFRLSSNIGSVILNFQFGSNQVATLRYAQAVQMDTILAQPWDIYVMMGQANIAAGTNGLGIDPARDDWSDPSLRYMPCSTYTGHMTTMGTVEALRAPLQMNANTSEAITAGYRSSGVSPAIAFAKRILESTAAGRNVCIVAAAVSGTKLVGSDGHWLPGSSNPFAYDHAVARIAEAMTAAPAGSKIKGVGWCQGESDTSNAATYATNWATMRAAFEATWTTNGWTDDPVTWIIGGLVPDSTNVNIPTLIAAQNNMDYQSGHADAQERCRVVNRGNGVEADGIHATAASNRDLGRRMAQRILDAS